MTSRGRKYVLGCAGVGVLVIGLVVVGVYGYGIYTRNSSEEEALVIARQLGYTEANKLVVHRRCIDIGCFQSIIYTTSLSTKDLRTAVAKLNFDERFANSANGSVIFTHVNLYTSHTLTADGDAFVETLPPPDKRPSAWEWALTSPQDRWVNVYLYETDALPVVYAFDGHPIQGNVVELLLWDSHP